MCSTVVQTWVIHCDEILSEVLDAIKLVDGGFKHCVYSSNPAITSYSKYIVWDKCI